MSTRNDKVLSCAEVELLLCEYVDGTLQHGQKLAVERHLAACSACATLAEEAAGAVSFLSSVPAVEPPDELVTRLLFKTPTATGSPRPGRLRGLFTGWVRPILQPRFAMGMAMTILSFSLLSRFAGIPDRPLQPSDLHPARVWEQIDDRLRRTWDSIVKYYDNLRVVMEIQNRLSEWTVETPEAESETLVPPEAEVFPEPSSRSPETDERSTQR